MHPILYRWQRADGGYFPAYPMTEEEASAVAMNLGCEVQKVPGSRQSPYASQPKREVAASDRAVGI